MSLGFPGPLLVALGLTLGCAKTTELRPQTSPASPYAPASAPYAVGLASWYGRAFAGRPTASGERFDPRLLTAAHRTLPFGTWVEVRRSETGRSVCVRVNDRGPNGRAAHRQIDVSERAAQHLGLVQVGVARVELRVVPGPCAAQ